VPKLPHYFNLLNELFTSARREPLEYERFDGNSCAAPFSPVNLPVAAPSQAALFVLHKREICCFELPAILFLDSHSTFRGEMWLAIAYDLGLKYSQRREARLFLLSFLATAICTSSSLPSRTCFFFSPHVAMHAVPLPCIHYHI
jgi:hypothetical protein